MPVTRRLWVAVAVAALSAWVASAYWRWVDWPADIDQLWLAARALMGGENPYHTVGPEGPYWFPFPLYYPLPAVLLTAPLALLPLDLARAAFVALSAGVLCFTLTRDGFRRLPVLLSGAFLMCILFAQWTPLLMAGFFVPALAWVWIVKPNLAVALLAAEGSGRAFRQVATAAVLLTLLSFLVLPTWSRDWMVQLRSAAHFVPPVLLPGGFLLLLAGLRWRRPEARLFLAWACVPHTTLAYETLPVLLVARRGREAVLLALLSLAHFVLQQFAGGALFAPGASFLGVFPDFVRQTGTVSIALIYWPALLLLLTRPNEGEAPGWALAARHLALRLRSLGTAPRVAQLQPGGDARSSVPASTATQ